MMSGIELIQQERERQVTVEGWTSQHDDQHENGELVRAAIAYALAAHPHENADDSLERSFWPWDMEWWKPRGDQVRSLAKAGALIAAEIDRLQRFDAVP